MVCNGVAGVGSSGNTPEKKPVQQAQPQKQEEVSAWDKVKDAAKNLGSSIYDCTFTGVLDKELNLGIKDGIKRGIEKGKTVVNNIADEVVNEKPVVNGIADGVVKCAFPLPYILYNSIFGNDD